MIAALYVETNGSYFDLPGIDPWDEARDARKYAGPWPVVAHPPCQRWGKFYAGAPWKIARTGERHESGDDGGCFAAALDAVRTWGGILEHPEGSRAWAHFNLTKPTRERGWVRADWPGHDGWTCSVDQGHYGHQARKPTWLYAHGVELPELNWSPSIGTYLDEGSARPREGGPSPQDDGQVWHLPNDEHSRSDQDARALPRSAHRDSAIGAKS